MIRKLVNPISQPKYYCRLVDDIFLMLEHKDHVKKFLGYINSRHRNIEFTCEEESNDKISFLDLCITRPNDNLVTSLYRKKSFISVFLNYNSFLPTNYKKGLIDTLLFPSSNICADYSILYNQIKYSKTIWQKISFPFFFIYNCINFF